MAPIEIEFLNNWSKKEALTQVIGELEVRERWGLKELILSVEPGEIGLIRGPGPEGLSLMVECNEKDDGGEITCSVDGGKVEGDWTGIKVSFDPKDLTQILEAGRTELVSFREMPLAEIRHIPKTPRRWWDSLKRRLGV